MAVNRCTFSNDLKAKDLCYSDEFFKLRSEKVIPSDSFTFDSYEAFKNLVDFKTNNYSNLFLINKKKNSQWLKSNKKTYEEVGGLATTISWFSYDPEEIRDNGSWLYFGKNYELFDINVKRIESLITRGRPTKNYFNHIFYLQFLNDNECRILHTFGDLTFYLTVDQMKIISFKREPKQNQEKFVFTRQGRKIKFYKSIFHKEYDVNGDIVSGKGNHQLYSLGVQRKNDGQGALRVYPIGQDGVQCQAYINASSNDFDFYVDSSWISYDRKGYISSIDQNKSAFNLSTQALIHHQYNKEDGMNFIPLKNTLSPKGNVMRGSNLMITDNNLPDVDFKIYTSIQSGLNQETGFQNITLTFNFFDQQIEVNDGDEVFFTISQSQEQTGIPTLWPYKQININDTKFVKNGSFASDIPQFSDKIKKFQNNKNKIKSESGDVVQANNKTYLCSWLYKKNHSDQPIWLDRYYYPDFISRKEALSEKSTYNQSFENILDKNYSNDSSFGDKISKMTYFDKMSDLVIQQGNTYVYNRVSSKQIEKILQSIEENRIKTGINQKKKEINLHEQFLFDNENYFKIKSSDWKNSNSINLNVDLFLNKNKPIGIQLFGNDYTNGFNIQNRKDLVPYHYYATDQTIYLCNNKFDIAHAFNVYQKYGDKILKVILGDTFDDLYIISNIFIYVFSYDLRLKTRINLSKFSQTIYVQGDNQDGEHYTKFFGTEHVANYPYVFNGVKTKMINGWQIDVKLNSTETQIEVKKPIFTSKIRFSMYDDVSGKFFIPSNLSKLLCQSNPIAYKNNLFVPIDSRILKIIFMPNTQNDRQIFTESIRQEYPCAMRWLEMYNEYHLNYNGADDQQISTQLGFVQVENRIKNLYIDSDQMVYGFNYDMIAPSPDGDTIYGIYSWEKYLATGGWYWLFNQSLSKIKSDVATSKYAQFASPNSIDKIKLNNNGQMCLIRNFHNFADNEYQDNNKRIQIYDKTKTRIYQYDLSSYQQVISLDSYNFIDEAHVERRCFTALIKSYNYIYQVTYLCDDASMIIKNSKLPTNTLVGFNQINNSDSLLRFVDKNSLFFNLHLPSRYIYDNVAVIEWSLKDLQQGWYNINVQIDLQQAIFQVRINDQVLERIDNKTHKWFQPHVNSNGNIFNNTFYVSCLGKRYGTTANNILNNAIFDPYVCKGGKMKNLTIYNKKLKFHQYQAMRLRGQRVNTINLTLPSGNRNGIEQIIRFFKYKSSPSISNSVKIRISGAGLQTQGQYDLLRREIFTALENEKDCLVKVKEIEFV